MNGHYIGFPMIGLHPLDIATITTYLGIVIIVGRRMSRAAASQEGFFLAGRKLSKAYQFFLTFGHSTDAAGAVSTASVVYQQGVSGVWLGFQLIFINPYYWFMHVWFRRVRLMTMADLFVDRLGSHRLAAFYAIFQSIATVIVVLGFGNLVTYKISSALLVKPESSWTIEERRAVDEHRELKHLAEEARAGTLEAEAAARLAVLREKEAHGDLRSYIAAVPPAIFYLVYTGIVGAYIVLGGMAATAVNEVLQSLLVFMFSLLLLPAGLIAIGGWGALAEKVPARMFDLVSATTSDGKFTWLTLVALVLVTLVQINGIIGNMGISGSARDESAARFGAVAGTFAKRVVFIFWAFCGLVGVAMFQGPEKLADPDLVWGAMSRQLLGPGLLGLMLVGVLAANMSTVAAQAVSVSALLVRNVYAPFRPGMSETEAVCAGRIALVAALAIGILAALQMDDVISVFLLLKTISVPCGAAVLLMFLWRRLTVPATWIGLLVAIAVNIVLPWLVPQVPALRTHPSLVLRTSHEPGRMQPIYFEKVAREIPTDATSLLVGSGRFHFELWLLDRVGFGTQRRSPSEQLSARLLFNAISPFVLLIGLSLVTQPPPRPLVDAFFGKMKTPVDCDPTIDAAELAETARHPARFDHLKLFPRSTWEWTRWNREDAAGFLACCLLSGAVILLFWGLLRVAAPAP